MANARRPYPFILFDADDTLLDFHAAQRAALEDTFIYAGIDATEAAFRRFDECNRHVWGLLEKGQITPERLQIARFEAFLAGTDADVEQVSNHFVQALSQQAPLLPSALELCQTLKQAGLRLALVTNGLKVVQRGRLSRCPITALFEPQAIIISQEHGIAKPNPELFHIALRALGAQPDQALVVGDSLASDIAGGRAAGIHTCWFAPHGTAPHGDIQPTYTIPTLSALLPIVLPEG